MLGFKTLGKEELDKNQLCTTECGKDLGVMVFSDH